jgi:hypothetical protein
LLGEQDEKGQERGPVVLQPTPATQKRPDGIDVESIDSEELILADIAHHLSESGDLTRFEDRPAAGGIESLYIQRLQRSRNGQIVV